MKMAGKENLMSWNEGVIVPGKLRRLDAEKSTSR